MECDPAAVNAQLERILASPMFAKSERMSRFLRHVVEAAVQGDAGRLKEYSIGLEVFDKGEDFDPRIDPVVRSEARRLRLKLAEYYESQGSGDPIRIDLPKGSYSPIIEVRESTIRHAAAMPRGRPLLAIIVALALALTGALATWLVLRHRTAAIRPRSVAVLPFENLSSDPENEYFSEGLTEEILSELAQVPGLKVVARTSTFQFKGKHEDIRTLGKLLNVDAVLEGSVRKDGSHIRITQQLIDASTGYHLWSVEFDREFHNILDVQKEVGGAVARVLRGRVMVPVSLSPSGPSILALTTNADFAHPVMQLGMLDLGRGIFRSQVTLSTALVGIGRDRKGQLYAVDYQNRLVRIDAVTGQVTPIGPTGLTDPGPLGPAVDVFGSLATGELYLLDWDKFLYSVDPTTGAVRKIGATGLPRITKTTYGTSFAGNCDSLYLTMEEDDDKGNSLIPPTLYRIDPHTAQATLVGRTASFIGGSSFLGETLYGFKIDENIVGGTGAAQVLTIDVKTGTAKKVANLFVPSIFGAIDTSNHFGCGGK